MRIKKKNIRRLRDAAIRRRIMDAHVASRFYRDAAGFYRDATFENKLIAIAGSEAGKAAKSPDIVAENPKLSKDLSFIERLSPKVISGETSLSYFLKKLKQVMSAVPGKLKLVFQRVLDGLKAVKKSMSPEYKRMAVVDPSITKEANETSQLIRTKV